MNMARMVKPAAREAHAKSRISGQCRNYGYRAYAYVVQVSIAPHYRHPQCRHCLEPYVVHVHSKLGAETNEKASP